MGIIFMGNDWDSPKEEVRGPTRQPEGCLVAPLGAPFFLFNPLGVETPREELLSRYAAATVRKPTEEKTHLRGEIL